MQSYNHAIQGGEGGGHFLKIIECSLSTYQEERWQTTCFFVLLAISALLHPLAALTATFSAVAFYCYIYY